MCQFIMIMMVIHIIMMTTTIHITSLVIMLVTTNLMTLHLDGLVMIIIINIHGLIIHLIQTMVFLKDRIIKMEHGL
jgi:hypothetical protein